MKGLVIINTPISERKHVELDGLSIGQLVKANNEWTWWPDRKCRQLRAGVLRGIASELDRLSEVDQFLRNHD